MRTVFEHELHLKKYRVRDDLYYISTGYGRVSFIAQQWRAIQLAYALSKRRGAVDLSVGIVGGGVAGTTALVALRGLGFKNVRLYEAQAELLQSQNSAAHRHTHPSLNFWPEQLVGGDYCSTTSLPFMNWFYERADIVMGMIRADENVKDSMSCVSFGHVVKNIQRDGNKLLVTWHDIVKNISRSTEFDVIIIASGFGRERNLASSASGSYWWADHIKHYRSEPHHYMDSRIYVSGSGDGALIDICRLASKKGHIPDSDEGNHATSVVGELRADRYRLFDCFEQEGLPQTSDWEDRISKLYREKQGADFQTQAIVLIKSLLSLNASEHHVHPSGAAVSAIVKDNYREQLAHLKMVVRGEQTTANAAIVGLTPGTSPANLLLFVALTSPNTMDMFVSGQVEETAQRLQLTNAPYDEKTDIHIARNGAANEVGHLFEGDEYKADLVAFQSAADPEIDAIVSTDATSPEAYPHLSAPVNSAIRYGLAEKFLGRYLEGYLGAELLTDAGGAQTIEVRHANQNIAEAQFRRLGGIEPRLFGLSVRYMFEPLKGTASPAKASA